MTRTEALKVVADALSEAERKTDAVLQFLRESDQDFKYELAHHASQMRARLEDVEKGPGGWAD